MEEHLDMTFEPNDRKDNQNKDLLNCDKYLIELTNRVDYWYDKVKVNVLPANYFEKNPAIAKWRHYQKNRVTEQQLESWKKENKFHNGFVVLLGKTYDKDKTLYLICIDCDKKQAIDEILSIDKELNSIKSLSEKYLVEQHDDNPHSLHLYFLSPIPFPSKANDDRIGLDIRSNEKLLIVPAPNLHPDGHQWKIEERTDPPVLTTEEARTWLYNLDNICIKHGLRYLIQKKAEKVDSKLKK